MTIVRSETPRLSTFLANAVRSATILALLVCAPAAAQVQATIAAGTEETLAGIKTYEVATEAEASSQSDLWFCQVVGKPSAVVIPSPPGSGLPPTTTGTQALSSDPAWQVFRTAIMDSNLKASLETGGAAPAANCMGNCAQQWPTPPGCDPVAPTVYCCQVQAERDYCQSLCRCEGSVLPSTCRAVAAAEYVVDWMNCSMLDDEIF